MFKGSRSYSSKLSSPKNLKNHHSKDVNLKLQWKRSSRLDLRSNFVYYIPVAYNTLTMVTM